MYFDLRGKIAFITGGASGIGLAVAQRFCSAGARVVIADMQDGSAVALEMGASYRLLDVSDGDAVRQALIRDGVKSVEMGWILEDNAGMRNIIDTVGGDFSKRYRFYEKELT